MNWFNLIVPDQAAADKADIKPNEALTQKNGPLCNYIRSKVQFLFKKRGWDKSPS